MGRRKCELLLSEQIIDDRSNIGEHAAAEGDSLGLRRVPVQPVDGIGNRLLQLVEAISAQMLFRGLERRPLRCLDTSGSLFGTECSDQLASGGLVDDRRPHGWRFQRLTDRDPQYRRSGCDEIWAWGRLARTFNQNVTRRGGAPPCVGREDRQLRRHAASSRSRPVCATPPQPSRR